VNARQSSTLEQVETGASGVRILDDMRKLLELAYTPNKGSDYSATFHVRKKLVAIRKPRK
jgi:hypothetical protein